MGESVPAAMNAAQACQPNLQSVLSGNFDVDFTEPLAVDQHMEIISVVACLGMENLSNHFHLSHCHKHGIAWQQLCDDVAVALHRNIVLAKAWCNVSNLQIGLAHRCNGCHEEICAWMITGTLHHRSHIKACKAIPWEPLMIPLELDQLFKNLAQLIVSQQHDCHECQLWIPDDTWRLVDEQSLWILDDTWRLVDEQSQGKQQCHLLPDDLQALNHCIHCSLCEDHKQQAIEAALVANKLQIEAALVANELQMAWNIAKGWHHQASSHMPKPTVQDL